MSITDNSYPSVIRAEAIGTCRECKQACQRLYCVPGFSGARCWRCLLALGRQLAEDAAEHRYDTIHPYGQGGY